MNRKGVMVIVIVTILLLSIIFLITQTSTTEYTKIVNKISNRPVDGIAVSLYDVRFSENMDLMNLDIETDQVNGKLNEWQNSDYLVGIANEMFQSISSLEEIVSNGKFGNNGYWMIDMNVDYSDGTNADDYHKLFLLIDKESYNIMIPKEYIVKNEFNIAFSNHQLYRADEHIIKLIEGMVGELEKFIIEPVSPNISLDQNYGVSMVFLDFASDDRIIFRGYFGLFVYDLNNSTIVRSVDLESINCGAVQGSDACVVNVNKEVR